MSLHATEESSENGKMQHPVDGKAWKNINNLYPDFGEEKRNIQLGLDDDVFNPFGNPCWAYSMWPVILTPYDMPLWLCMEETSFMLTSHQQSIADAGSKTRPPMLEKGSYVPWSSRFLKYVNGKKEHGIRVKDSIFKGPYKFREITDPSSPKDAPIRRMQEYKDLTGEDKLRYEADIDAKNWILLVIPNDI
ncbi:reverse transcriptase domain, reverse transcriptase zinc-binding domain protein [Tanacetum coccineum]